MTRKQIDAAKKTLPGYRIPFSEWPEDKQRLEAELDCRDMINSCLCYGGIKDFWEECEWRIGDKSYAAPYIKALGRRRVEELVKEQEVDFAQAKVFHSVFTDDEGLTYNSIKWADE